MGEGLYKLEASDQILIVQSVHLYVIVSRNKYCLNQIDPALCQNVSCMNPLYFFSVWDSKMAAVTKNSAEHENDNISITA